MCPVDGRVSVIIPSRDERYLQATIDDVLAKAEGDVEVVVSLDGYWPAKVLRPDKRVTILHQGTVHNNKGMREAINSAVAISTGQYIMKLDEHCLMDQGYDRKLVAEHAEDNWVVIPRRYRLDPETWTVPKDPYRRPPIDYMYMAYPYERTNDWRCGLHGEEWRQRYHDRKDIPIDETMAWQGSCYFISRNWWDHLGPLDSKNYGWFTHEPQEIGNKTWLGGGALMVNKNTWYAHWHKGNKGRGYNFSNHQYAMHKEENERGRRFCIDYWVNNRWEDRVHDWEWLIEKFWPIPGWKETWRDDLITDREKELYNQPKMIGQVVNGVLTDARPA
jgi:glycosyltransferase involved in cell wall biosynthesis